MPGKAPTFLCVYPELDGGRHPVKTEIDRDFVVSVEMAATKPPEVWVLHRRTGFGAWVREKMTLVGSGEQRHAFEARIRFDRVGIHRYTVEAVGDPAAGNRGKGVTRFGRVLEVFVEPRVARCGTWYEMFPRSQGTQPGRSGTFQDCEARLPDIRRMGFDVIYLPPIHPIGRKNRKGRNSAPVAGPEDPGCVWSIGDASGGHKAIHPELGTIEDFRHFVEKAREHGIGIALDIALTCSHDHPWIREHPDWFFHNPDGSIRFAENPPKKYEDTVFLNFFPPDREAMWEELRSVFTYWIEQGVAIFRVDNPHTKPDEFWAWAIRKVKEEHPEAVFLSESFTFYERLERLAKLGFSQSYTYFTWRNERDELIEYMDRLCGNTVNDYLRPNLFANTPDILTKFLQESGRPGFVMRYALAATLAPTCGIYGGYELCDADGIAGTESYRDSEKYEVKVRDWDRPGNIKDAIAALNRIRAENPALHHLDNLTFCPSTDHKVLAYMKVSPDRANVILVVANLDPCEARRTRVTIPLQRIGFPSGEAYRAVELLSGRTYAFRGRDSWVRMDPHVDPVHVYRLDREAPPEPQQIEHDEARAHADALLELRDRVLRGSDLGARREMMKLFEEVIAPRICAGAAHDDAYHAAIDAESRRHGFDSLVEAWIATPGH